jgi:ADP-ribose pyrophosphatase YjhB (NUDIX family)
MARVDYYNDPNDPNAPKANSIVVAVTAFVQDDTGRVLLIRRTDNDLYAIPGGAQEIGEALTQTVVREVQEETGLTVEVTGLIGIYSDPAHVIAFTNGEVRQEFSICFRAHPTGGHLRTSSESSEVLWVNHTRLDRLNIHPSIRIRIIHGLSDPGARPYFT